MEGQIRVIFSEGSTKQSGNNKTTINTKTGEVKTPQKVKQDNSNTSLVNHALNNYVLGQAKKVGQILLSEALYEINKYYDLTDNVENKRDLHIAINMIHRGANFIGATLAGAKIGGVPGAVIGFGVSAVNEAINIYQGYDQQNIQLRQLQTQLEYTRERAGYSLTSGSIGENK